MRPWIEESCDREERILPLIFNFTPQMFCLIFLAICALSGTPKGAFSQSPRANLSENLDPSQVLGRANTYFNSFKTMIASFDQIGADGTKVRGKFYLQKPGRLRFVYSPPASQEIIADGTSVAVRDNKLATQDLYFIGQTPLKFLLSENLRLEQNTRVLKVGYQVGREDKLKNKEIFIVFEDKATFGGTSHITLFFDSVRFVLKGWEILDPQGYITHISLSEIDFLTPPDPQLFKIDLQRLLPTR